MKAKNENRLCARYAREKRTCLFKNSTSFSSNSPLFERKQTHPQPSLRSTRPYTCPLVGFAHLTGRKTPHGQTQEQSYEALNLFRTKGETIFYRPVHSITRKKRGVVRVFTFFVLSIRFILLYLHAELLCAFRSDAQRFALSSPSRRRGTDGLRPQKQSPLPAVSSKRGTPLATK